MAAGRGSEDETEEPAPLRRLRRLVSALMVTLIVGVVVVVALLVVRLGPFGAAPALPDAVRLPAGERAEAVTLGHDWIAVVTRDVDGLERIRVLDRVSGRERASMPILPAD